MYTKDYSEYNVRVWLTDDYDVLVSNRLYDVAFTSYDDFNNVFVALINGYIVIEELTPAMSHHVRSNLDNPPGEFFQYIGIHDSTWCTLCRQFYGKCP